LEKVSFLLELESIKWESGIKNQDEKHRADVEGISRTSSFGICKAPLIIVNNKALPKDQEFRKCARSNFCRLSLSLSTFINTKQNRKRERKKLLQLPVGWAVLDTKTSLKFGADEEPDITAVENRLCVLVRMCASLLLNLN